MTRPVKRERASHATVAATARTTPGQWVRVGSYASRYSAKNVAFHIRCGGGRALANAYAPSGAFDARIQDGEFDTEVYAQFKTEDGTQ